jgi:tRNA pseudouridine55 synthase
VEVDRPGRPVTVHSFDIDSLQAGVLKVRIACSSGTYIRVLAADLGQALGGGAHVARLRRTSVGPWTAAEAAPLEGLGAGDVRPPAAALPWMASVTVTTEVAQDARYGKVLARDGLSVTGDGPWQVVDPGGNLVAVYVPYDESRVKPAVVVAPAS